MNKIIASVILSLIVVCAISCQKDSTTISPYIFFKKGAGYVSQDDTIAKGSVLTIGIITKRASSTEILTRLSEVVTYDNTFDSTLSNIIIPSNTATDSFNHNYTINTRSIPGTEKYTFTIYDQNGSANTLKLTIRTE